MIVSKESYNIREIIAVLARRYDEHQTMGSLSIFQADRCILTVKTLELPWKNNERKVSCIPRGEYECKGIQHSRFGHSWLVQNVPGRDGILIHTGNFASGAKVDIEGCIMPGTIFVDINNDGNLDTYDSSKAMNLLRVVLPNKFRLVIL
jgi:hypothetical protein